MNQDLQAECDGCELRDRRTFLRDTTVALAAALTAVLGVPTDAFALPVSIGSATGGTGPERTYAIPPGDGTVIDKANEVILVRYQKVAYAFALSCPHQRTLLRWLDSDTRFQCPKHKSKYQPDGTFISGKATRNMDRHPIRRAGKLLAVDPTILIRSDKEPEKWTAARVTV